MVLHHHDFGKAQRQLLNFITVKTVSTTRFLLLAEQMQAAIKKDKNFSKNMKLLKPNRRNGGIYGIKAKMNGQTKSGPYCLMMYEVFLWMNM